MKVFSDSIVANVNSFLPFTASNISSNKTTGDILFIVTTDDYMINIPYVDDYSIYVKESDTRRNTVQKLPIKDFYNNYKNYKIALYRPTKSELIEKLLLPLKFRVTLDTLILQAFLIGFMETKDDEKVLLNKDTKRKLQIVEEKVKVLMKLFPDKEKLDKEFKIVRDVVNDVVQNIDNKQYTSGYNEEPKNKVIRLVSLLLLNTLLYGRMDQKIAVIDVSNLDDYRRFTLRMEFLLMGVITRIREDSDELLIKFSNILRENSIMTESLFNIKRPSNRNLYFQTIKDITIIDGDIVDIPDVETIWNDGVLLFKNDIEVRNLNA